LPEQKKPNLAQWANAFRLMRERDGRKPDRIREVAAWAISGFVLDPEYLNARKSSAKSLTRLIGDMNAKPATNGKSKYTGANSLFTEHKEGTHGDF
jgi:hypothetical protein